MSRLALVCALAWGCAAAAPTYREPCAPLLAHVHEQGVDYPALAADAARPRCAASLAAARPRRFTREEQIAFWVNAYNLGTLLLLASEPERWSPRQDGGAIFSDTPFPVGGARRTLDHIEKVELSRLAREPRIAFVLSCGTRGCAPIPSRLATPALLPELMREGEARFFAQRQNLEVDLAAGLVYTSQLLSPGWHGQDFTRAGISVEELVARHLQPAHATRLREGKLRLAFRTYDWRLNRLWPAIGLP